MTATDQPSLGLGRAVRCGTTESIDAERTAMIEIREAKGPGDWAAATTLLLDYLDWLRAEVGVEPLEVQPAFGDEITDLAAYYSAADTAFLVAVNNDRVVGTVAVKNHPDCSTELKRLFVGATGRRSGVGDRLVAAAVARAEQSGAERIWLETVAGVMDQAIALYRRHGFMVVAEQAGLPVAGMITMERAQRQARG